MNQGAAAKGKAGRRLCVAGPAAQLTPVRAAMDMVGAAYLAKLQLEVELVEQDSISTVLYGLDGKPKMQENTIIPLPQVLEHIESMPQARAKQMRGHHTKDMETGNCDF